jgi:hypothetical protein
MDANAFKDLGLSVGQRLAVLKAVYLVKLAHDIPLGPDDYVPPCEYIISSLWLDANVHIAEAAEKLDEASVEKTSDGVTVDTLHDLLKAHGASASYCSRRAGLTVLQHNVFSKSKRRTACLERPFIPLWKT